MKVDFFSAYGRFEATEKVRTSGYVQTPLQCHCEERSDVAISCRNC